MRVDGCRDRKLGQPGHRCAHLGQIGAPGQIAQQDVQIHALAQLAQGHRQRRGIGSASEPLEVAVGPSERQVDRGLDGGAQGGIGDA